MVFAMQPFLIQECPFSRSFFNLIIRSASRVERCSKRCSKLAQSQPRYKVAQVLRVKCALHLNGFSDTFENDSIIIFHSLDLIMQWHREKMRINALLRLSMTITAINVKSFWAQLALRNVIRLLMSAKRASHETRSICPSFSAHCIPLMAPPTTRDIWPGLGRVL